MKYSLTTLFIFLFAAATFSQDEKKNFKPEAGAWNAEVNVSPLGSSPVSINYIRLRRFNSPDEAFRLGLSLGGRFESTSDDINFRTVEISIIPGFEKHFPGTDRLSPYVGGELDLTLKTSSVKGDDITDITGAWDTAGTEQAFFRGALNAVAGVDFYLARRLYMGTEFGFGFEVINIHDIEIDGQEPTERGSTFQFGPNFNSAFRLGFLF